MTDRLEIGSIDLIATRAETGTGEYDWVEHDEQPSYEFAFESAAGCSGCVTASPTLTKDTLSYVVRPISFTCFSANGKTAAENRDALIAMLNGATAYSMRNTCSPDFTGAAVLMIRQSGDQSVPDVWTVKRYQRKRIRLDLDFNRMMLDVDLYLTEGGPVLDPLTGLTAFGANGNPVQGGTVAPLIARIEVAEFTRMGGNAPRNLGVFGPILIHAATAEFVRTGGA